MIHFYSDLRFLLLAILLLSGTQLEAQGWSWVNHAASSGSERAHDVAVDTANGAVIVVGTWDGTDLSADLGPDFSAGGGGMDGLVAKYDLAGNLIWSFSLESPGDDEVLSVDTDELGNVFIAGYFTNNLNFQGNGGRSEILVNPSGNNAFLAKYNPDGRLNWTINNGSAGNAEGRGVVADTAGVYTTGSYASNLNFVSAATAPVFNLISGLAAAPAGSMFLAHYDSAGTLNWLADAGIFGFDTGRDLALNAGKVYLIGDFQSPILDVWDGTRPAGATGFIPNSGGRDAVVMAFRRNSGILSWLRPLVCTDDDFGNAIGVEDQVIIHGGVGATGAITFPGGVVPTVSGTRNQMDPYVAVLDSSSGLTVWARVDAGAGMDMGQGLSPDGAGNVLLTGGFENDINFSGTALTATGNTDIYVAKYEIATGNLEFVKQPAMTDFDQGMGVAAYDSVYAFVAGELRSESNFPPIAASSLPNSANLFIAQCSEGVIAVTDSICVFGGDSIGINPLINDFSPILPTVTASLLTPPVNGNAILISGDSIEYKPNAGFTGIDSVQYLACDNLNQCDSAWIYFLVTTPPAVIFNGLAAGYCPGSTVSLLSGVPPGGVFAGPGISGNTFDPSVVGPGLHYIQYTYTTAQGCVGVDSQAVTISTPITPSLGSLDIFHCINDTVATLVGSPLGGVFTVNGVIDSVFDPQVQGIGGPYPVRYFFTDTVGCDYTDSLFLFVLPLPTVTLTGVSDTVCASDPVSMLMGSPGGGTFSGPGLTGSQFNPGPIGPGQYDLIYAWADANGCTGFDTLSVTVVGPAVSFSGLPAVSCLNSISAILVGTPTGGTFSGTGIVGNQFIAGVAGLGIHEVYYSFTDSTGCVGIDTQFTEVFDLPDPELSGLDTLYCLNGTVVTLVGIPSGGVFLGPGVSGGTFDPSLAGLGQHPVTYTLTDGNGCIGIDTVTVQVDSALNAVLTGLDSTYCANDAMVTLSGAPAGGVFSGPGIFGNEFSPADAGPGVHTVQYLIANAGCSDTLDRLVVVYALPEVSMTLLDPEYCITDPEVPLLPDPSGGSLTGPVTPTESFDPAQAGAGFHILRYLYTDAKGCTDSVVTSTDVFELPSPVNAGPDQDILIGTSTQLSADPVTVGTGMWTGGIGTGTLMDPIDPATTVTELGTGANTFIWTATNGACIQNDDVNINLLDFPEERGLSPNGDNINDVLIIPGVKDFTEVRFQVFTRWGTLVWESNDYANDWDGTNQAGEELPDDTYFYTLELPASSTNNGEVQQYKGFIFLKR